MVYRMSKKGKSVKRKGLGKTDCKSNESGPAAPAKGRLLSCIGQLIGWLNLYRGQLASALAHCEQQEAGQATWKNLALCLTTMHAPVTAKDLALLQPLLDPQGSGIGDVQSLYSTLLAHQQELRLTEAVSCEPEVCSGCGLRLPQPQQDSNPSYVEVRLLLAPFASTAHHPCHMTYLVPTSTTILSLQHQLNSSLGTTATAVAVFSEQCVKPSNRIPPRCTLMEMGVVGGERTTPPKATLYYDYIPVSIQCPVLMTDHYYGDVDQSN